MSTSKKPQSVDAYIASAPNAQQSKLKEMRAAIRKAAPEAEERMSYGMPYYHHKGRLAYFGFAKHHVGLYIPPPIIEEHERELRSYETARATIRFPLGKRLPVALVRKLIAARKRMNEAKSEIKAPPK